MCKIKLGVQIRNYAKMRESFVLSRERGFSCVELWISIFDPDLPGHLCQRSDEIKEAAYASGEEVLIHCDTGFYLSHPSLSVRRKAWNSLRDALTLAKAIEAKVVSFTCPSYGLLPATFYKESNSKQFSRIPQELVFISVKEAQKILTEGLARLKSSILPHDSKIVIAIENAAGFSRMKHVALARTIDDIEEIISKTGISALLDVGHANISGIPIEKFIKRLQAKIVELHLHDNDGRTDQHQLPGQGTIKFKSLFSLLERFHFNGYIIIEHPPLCDIEMLEDREKIDLIVRQIKEWNKGC